MTAPRIDGGPTRAIDSNTILCLLMPRCCGSVPIHSMPTFGKNMKHGFSVGSTSGGHYSCKNIYLSLSGISFPKKAEKGTSFPEGISAVAGFQLICKCCFNQPDDHCDQMECKDMGPNFERDFNTTCVCHEQNDYPRGICLRENSRGLQKSYTIANPFPSFRNISTTEKKNSESSEKKQPDPVYYKAIWDQIKKSKIILVLVLILLVGVLVAVCFGCFVICSERAKTSRNTRQKRNDRLEAEKKLLEIANNQDPDQYLP
ncbi:hypothetical protein FO519_002078 [Halicephalobus sp. NKZ332]|nr:hypothetical protein FO519_002078 [Halicephalobus sp. NKZ332]